MLEEMHLIITLEELRKILEKNIYLFYRNSKKN